MSFSLCDTVNRQRVFIRQKLDVVGRWDPHYHSPRFAGLDAELDEVRATPIRKVSDKIFSGITPLSGGDAYADNPEGIAFVRSGDFNEDGTIKEAALIRLKREVHEKLMRRSQLKPCDVLFAIVGATIGKVGVFPGGYEANINQAVCAVRLSGDVLPRFLHAFFLTRLGQEQIQRVKRPVARANINLEEIASLRVPLLPDLKQQAVVAAMKKAFDQKVATELSASELLQGIDDVLLHELGIPRKPELPSTLESRIFRTPLSELTGQRWDPNYAKHMFRFLSRIKSCKHPPKKLKDFVATVQYGISERATEDEVGVPMLRMLNLQDGDWSLSDLKYIAMTDDEKKPYLVKRGDILFNRTNSKERVGKCNVVDFDGEYVFASYLMRVTLKAGAEMLPEFLVAFMASSLGRMQIDAVSRQIAGMTNINAEEVRELLIPAIGRKSQERVVERVASIREQVRSLREKGRTDLEKAKRDIEALILGKEAAV